MESNGKRKRAAVGRKGGANAVRGYAAADFPLASTGAPPGAFWPAPGAKRPISAKSARRSKRLSPKKLWGILVCYLKRPLTRRRLPA